MIYPLGTTVIIQDLNTRKQEFLNGHSNNVSCLAVSKSGRYLASGQVRKKPIKFYFFKQLPTLFLNQEK